MPTTITYSKSAQGWTSFWSFIPDWMLGVSNTFYTWKNGDLYKHDSNQSRSNFYGSQHQANITTVFNQENTQNKVFKTLEIESTHPWDSYFMTDLSSGYNASSYFEEKEGGWFSYIREVDQLLGFDTHELSTQGLGQALSYTTGVLTFPFVDSNISAGDRLYTCDVAINSFTYIGDVVSHNSTSVTFTPVGPITILPGTFIVYVKNNQAESFGLRGYYLQVKLELPISLSSQQVELFEISTSAFKSYP